MSCWRSWRRCKQQCEFFATVFGMRWGLEVMCAVCNNILWKWKLQWNRFFEEKSLKDGACYEVVVDKALANTCRNSVMIVINRAIIHWPCEWPEGAWFYPPAETKQGCPVRPLGGRSPLSHSRRSCYHSNQSLSLSRFEALPGWEKHPGAVLSSVVG